MAEQKLKASPYLRTPPQSIEAEMALLGSIMSRSDVIHDIGAFVSDNSFYAEKHRIIFRMMMELVSKASPIDLLSLSNALRERGQLDQVGGASYLTELINTVPSASNASYYAEIVQKKHAMRNLIACAEDIGRMGYDESNELDFILDSAEKKILEATNIGSAKQFSFLGDELSEAWERIDHLHKNHDGLRGVPTGFKELDDRLSGLQESDLIILAARPSMGKTSLALDIARQAAVDHNIPVGIFSLEMSSQQLVDRMLAAQSRVDAWKLRTGRGFAESDFDSMRAAIDKLSKAPIYIDDQPANNILKMKSVARRLKNEKSLGLIIVDYLQLMQPTSKGYNDNIVQQVTEISRSLKQLARELKVPVLALSQLSRAVEARGGKPRLSDLRDSGSIEQDADVVMFIHREDKQKEGSDRPNIAEIMIEKHRNGATGKAELYFDDKKATFLNIDKNFGVPEKSDDF